MHTYIVRYSAAGSVFPVWRATYLIGRCCVGIETTAAAGAREDVGKGRGRGREKASYDQDGMHLRGRHLRLTRDGREKAMGELTGSL